MALIGLPLLIRNVPKHFQNGYPGIIGVLGPRARLVKVCSRGWLAGWQDRMTMRVMASFIPIEAGVRYPL
jgi:hypothetical protein